MTRKAVPTSDHIQISLDIKHKITTRTHHTHKHNFQQLTNTAFLSLTEVQNILEQTVQICLQIYNRNINSL